MLSPDPLVTGLMSGLVIGLSALAVTLVFGVARCPNAATGDVMSASADAAFAVAADPSLARVFGIDPTRVMLTLWALAGGVSAVAGLVLGLKTVVTPDLGWNLVLPAFAAAVLGGIGSPLGAVVAGILLGIVQEVATPFVGFTDKIAIAFAVLMLVLLVRPRRGSPLMEASLFVIAIFTLLTLGLNLQYGLTGLTDVGLVGFFSIGAYAPAILTAWGYPSPLGFAAGAVLAVLAAWPVGLVALRRRDGGLSGGERQQLAFARARMTRPRLIVLDEPIAALPPALVDDRFRRIAAPAAGGTAVLLIEPRARQALTISDVGAIMDLGRVAMSGPARTLLDDERTARLSLGQAADRDA